jgi:hypothetical protein
VTPEQKAALDLAVLNLKTHGDDQLLNAVQPLIDFYEARRTVSGQEAEWWEVTTDGEREVVSTDHYRRHDWPRSTARPLFGAPIPATEQKEPK